LYKFRRNDEMTAQKLIIKGLVQGVGFRPFVYRLAKTMGLNGWVENTNDGVIIFIEGEEKAIKPFEERLVTEQPRIAMIQSIESKNEAPMFMEDFSIKWSRDINDQVTQVSPDIAVCQDCLDDMKSQEHRLDYPFINCTNCGPRFSIIKDLPYDRARTTMAPFEMCPACRSEYEDVMDRRFHAQPVACNTCGPRYTLVQDKEVIDDYQVILKELSDAISESGIAVIKGIGGFFIACNALDKTAIEKLRKLKHRYGKPFAVMFRDSGIANEYVEMGEIAKKQIESWRRPIVILKARKQLPENVSNGFPTIGAMLPYMPIHYQLFELLDTPAIVMTSGNFSEEPIIINDEIALKKFSSKVDAIVINDREIYNRIDDSVMMISGEKPRMLRRSRGYVPEPVFLTRNVDGIVAVGAELVNCFCIGKENRAILGQHIGDLQNLDTLEFFEESLSRFLKLLRVSPRLIAHDIHPDYLSTRYAQSLNIPTVQVQHHHAHIVSAMAENNLVDKVIGISFDGTGLGTDGHIWGSEFMVCDTKSFERISHFDYVPVPGGDLAVKEPWRMALSYMHTLLGKDSIKKHEDLFNYLSGSKINLVVEAIEKSINTPLGCGAGRLFDAVSALLGICTESSFHAEAPMRLEASAINKNASPYEFNIGVCIDFKPMFEAILDELDKGIAPEKIAGRFQNTMVEVILKGAEEIRKDTGLNDVVLSGGTFQNQYISERAEKVLILNKFKVHIPSLIPVNDGGIALGQLMTATNYLK